MKRCARPLCGLACFLLVALLTACATPLASAPRSQRASPSTAQALNVPDSELSQPLVLVIYGDMRFTDLSEKVAAAPAPRRALAEKVASEHPDALFLTGDIPWHGGDLADYREFELETAAWRRQHLRVYPVLGNHEFSQCEEPRCLQNWWHAFPQLQGWRWYTVALGSQVRAFALDSNSSLLPGSEQRHWLEQEMETLPPEARFVIITLHHPPVADQSLVIVRKNERALARYLSSVERRSSAKFIVCSGHVHNYERFQRAGVVYLVSGGGGAKPLRVHRLFGDRYRHAPFPNYHYIRLEVQDGRLKAEMVRLEDYRDAAPHTWAVRDRFELRADPPGVFHRQPARND